MDRGAGGSCKVRHLDRRYGSAYSPALNPRLIQLYPDSIPVPATPDFPSQRPRRDVRYGDEEIDDGDGSRGLNLCPPY